MSTKTRAYAEICLWLAILVIDILTLAFFAGSWPWRIFDMVAALVSMSCVIWGARDLYTIGQTRGFSIGWNQGYNAAVSGMRAVPWAPYLMTDDTNTEQES